MIRRRDIAEILMRTQGIKFQIAKQIVDDFFDCIADSLVEREIINIPRFGTLSVNDKKPKRGWNERTKEYYLCLPRSTIDFRISKRWRDKLNQDE